MYNGYHGYYRTTSLDQIIALNSQTPAAIRASKRISALHSNVCANENLTEEDWNFLIKKVKKSDDVYSLAYNSSTLEQAETILKDRRHTPKVGLIRGNNPKVDEDFLRKLHQVAFDSTTVQEALISRSDLPTDVLEKISENPKSSYRIIYALTHNEKVNAAWIIEYFNRQIGDYERWREVHRMPILLERHPGLKIHFLDRVLNEDSTIKRNHRLEILSALAETKYLSDREADEIVNYIMRTKSQSQLKVKIVLGLLGNPNLSFTTAQKAVDLARSSKIQALASHLQRDKIENLASLRLKFAGTYLEPGWDNIQGSEQRKMLKVFATETENHAARAGVKNQHNNHGHFNQSDEPLTSEQAGSLSAKPSDSQPYWTWRAEASKAVWYIDQEFADEDEKTWFNLLSLCQSWDGTINELLQASRNL